MTTAGRRLCHWLLTAFLERGVDPARAAQRHHLLRAQAARSLTPEECRAFLGPYARVRFLPQPRR